jgi:CBS domain-containing protein
MTTAADLLRQKSPATYTIESEAPVLEAVRLMADHAIGALLVMNGDQLAGIISERDYARKVALLGRSSSETPVWQIMASPVITVTPDQTVRDCMELMTNNRVRHLPVVEEGRVLGVLSIGDCVRYIVEEQQRTIEHLQSYIHG